MNRKENCRCENLILEKPKIINATLDNVTHSAVKRCVDCGGKFKRKSYYYERYAPHVATPTKSNFAVGHFYVEKNVEPDYYEEQVPLASY